jgi:hypothetical protein
MPTGGRPLYVLHTDPELRDRLSRLPGKPYAVHVVRGWGSLAATLRKAPPTAVSIVDPVEGGGLSSDLQGLLRELPSATVVAALALLPDSSDLVRTLVTWGIADLIDLAREVTLPALQRRISYVRNRRIHRLLAHAFPNGLPSRSRSLLEIAAEMVAEGAGRRSWPTCWASICAPCPGGARGPIFPRRAVSWRGCGS